jgi:hypothetical protein
MSEWMLYVYKQRPRPESAVGVNVRLEAVAPDMSYMDLGSTTSDAYGNYAFSFSPETEGTYTIIATFEGSGGYYGSTDTTYVNVGAVTSGTPIEPEPDTPHGTPLITTEVAIILAVVVAAVVGIGAYVLLRRK